MKDLLLYLMIARGLSYKEAVSVINLYGKIAKDATYTVPEDFLAVWESELRATQEAAHANFIDVVKNLLQFARKFDRVG